MGYNVNQENFFKKIFVFDKNEWISFDSMSTEKQNKILEDIGEAIQNCINSEKEKIKDQIIDQSKDQRKENGDDNYVDENE